MLIAMWRANEAGKKERKVKLIYVLLPGQIGIEFRVMNVETSLKVSVSEWPLDSERVD